MKVSLKWAQYYSNVDLGQIGKDKLVEKIGAQLGEVENVEDLGKKYQGIVLAKVISCQKHSDADKLSVCMLDDGGKVANVERSEQGYVQVVCGAPNVKEGQMVAWIPPGVTVPNTAGKEPFVLEARDIRGQKSNGMIASAHELAFSDDHTGILVVDIENATPGMAFTEAYALDDYIIEIENKMFTHRPDCFGILGVARELAGIQGRAFKSPDWYLQGQTTGQAQTSQNEALEVKVADQKLVPRFMAVAMSDIKVGPSPGWLQSYLTRVGAKPINNIVDLTNYFMLLSGQPLHAYDADKLKTVGKQQGLSLETRLSHKGEKITLLGGKVQELQDDSTILITSHDVPVGIGGVMGGAETEVDEHTQNIVLECATFDMFNIRRTAMQYGLFTDAVTRFTKGQSPLQNDRVLAKIISDVQRLAGGKMASDVKDVHTELLAQSTVTVTAQFINDRLGEKLSGEEMAKLLTNVEFEVQVNGEELTVKAPFWRTDIEIPEDVVEEVGRLYGYDHLPLELPKRSIKPTEHNPMLQLKDTIREVLSSAGANEVLTYSFVHGDLLDKVGQKRENAYELSNALSPDLQYYRLSLIPSLLDKVHANVKQGYNQFALFEMNPVHAKDFIDKDNGLPKEDHRLALIFAAEDKTAKEAYGNAPYYQAKQYLTELLAALGIHQLNFMSATGHEPQAGISQAAIAPFEKKRSAIVKTTEGTFIAELGEFRTSVRKNLKLPQFVAGFELDLMQLLNLQERESPYVALPRFPKVEQDISLKVPAELAYEELFDFMQQNVQTPAKSAFWFAPLDIYQPQDNKTHKHITLRFTISSYERTLTSEEVNTLLDKAAAAAKEKFGAERI
ncbi:MAG TPA: phenylalanine--tRNA ligase subunit beta [Patescibacteria group bacterium]|nr:phenylalanine--tRNA ligase subunit beta [Patescibacteria group bacterium]